MFRLDYRIVYTNYDDFIGQNGFLQIRCNEYRYGEIYPKELEVFVDKVSLYDWFERLVRVMKNLMTKDYVVLSDVESYNTWIEFQKKKGMVIISIVEAEKKQGSKDIEFSLKEPASGAWTDQVISYKQLKTEIMEKAEEYIEIISVGNTKNLRINRLKENLEFLKKYPD